MQSLSVEETTGRNRARTVLTAGIISVLTVSFCASVFGVGDAFLRILTVRGSTILDVALFLVGWVVAMLANPWVHESGHAFVGGALGARGFKLAKIRSRSRSAHQITMTNLSPGRLELTLVLVGGAGATAFMAALAFELSHFSWALFDGMGASFVLGLCREVNLWQDSDFSRLLELWTTTTNRKLRGGIPILRLQSPAVVRAGETILKPTSLEIKTGTVVGILGPNGSGKTTLLELLAGLQPESIDAREVPQGVRIAYAPVDGALIPNATFGETLNYYAEVTGSLRDRETEAALSLSNLIDHPVGHASKGELQRLSLAVAFQQRPDVLLLDEPDSGLDPAGRATLHRLLRNRADRGGAVVIVSHFVADILDVCSHVVVVRDGSVERYGPIDEFNDLGRLTHKIRAWINPDRISDFIQNGFTVARVTDDVAEVVKAGTPRDLIETSQLVGTAFRQFVLEGNTIE